MLLLNDLNKQYHSLKNEIDEAIARVLESGWYILGKELESFEKEFAAYTGRNYCAGVASGTEAITISLMALGIGRDDEVLVPSFTAFPTITGILLADATPVLVDVSPNDGLIDINKIEKKITSKTRAIVPVHLYGQSCEMGQLLHVALHYNLKVIEDCAQSAGALYKNRKTGFFGDCSAFSFYPTKNLGATGDGGAITTNDKDIYERLTQIRNYGQTGRYYHDSVGINSRLDEIQASILRVKLGYLDKWNERRREISKRYRAGLKHVEFIRENNYGTPNYHLFVIRHRERDRLITFLQSKGIQSLIHYPLPINKQKSFPLQKKEIFPGAELLASQVLSIPIFPELTNNEVEMIIEAVNKFK